MKKILLIDDNKEFNDALKECLEYGNFNVVCAFDGEQALSMIHSEKPDLIITDVVMPKIEGVEFLLEFKNMPQALTTKIIVMSGGVLFGGKNHLEAAKSFGADYTIKKPFELDELIKVIRNCLD